MSLPDDVVRMIWDHVRHDLRPRMRKQLKEDVRASAIVRMTGLYGKWMYDAFDIVLANDVPPEMHVHLVKFIAVCIWELMSLPTTTATEVPDKVRRYARWFWAAMPPPAILDGGRIEVGPPDWNYVFARIA